MSSGERAGEAEGGGSGGVGGEGSLAGLSCNETSMVRGRLEAGLEGREEDKPDGRMSVVTGGRGRLDFMRRGPWRAGMKVRGLLRGWVGVVLDVALANDVWDEAALS